jgi:hypothetical protein
MPTFTGTVIAGHVHPDDKAALAEHMAPLEGKQVAFTIDDLRSTEAHRYLFGPVYNAMLDYMGDTSEAAKLALHEVMKRRFLKKSIVRIVNYQTGEIEEEEVVESSTIQTVKGFYAFTEQVRLFASEWMGLTIPDPNPAFSTRRRKAA